MNPRCLIVPFVIIAGACLFAVPRHSSANMAQAGRMVILHVRVTDPSGKAVRDVSQDAFQVTEDGVPQKIELFMNEEIPLSYGLLIDSSGSMRSQFAAIVQAAKNIVKANTSADETFVVRFISSDKIENAQEFTTDKKLLLNVLDSLYIEGGQTAVLDAIYLGADYLAKRQTARDQLRRKVLILVTDGEERNSYYKKDQLFRLLESFDTQIFTIGFTKDLKSDKLDKAIQLLTQLATETGGRTFFPNSTADLSRITNEIINDIRTQYVIGYVPASDSKNGFNKVLVSITQGVDQEKRVAITRVGYSMQK